MTTAARPKAAPRGARARRRARARFEAYARCPSCNGIALALIAANPDQALCNRCGWSGPVDIWADPPAHARIARPITR